MTPRLTGIPYFETPPLQYWATAAIFAIAGEDEWTARLAPALAGFIAVLAVWATARRLYPRRAGWMAARRHRAQGTSLSKPRLPQQSVVCRLQRRVHARRSPLLLPADHRRFRHAVSLQLRGLGNHPGNLRLRTKAEPVNDMRQHLQKARAGMHLAISSMTALLRPPPITVPVRLDRLSGAGIR